MCVYVCVCVCVRVYVCVGMQVASLTSLGLSTCLSVPHVLDDTRFRCNASLDLVSSLSRSIGIDLHKYLAQ